MNFNQKLLATLRIFMGWIFLWPFLDKLFGLGFATSPEKAWLLGNSPTAGFLANSPKGPFAGIFKSLAGNVLVDWLFMLGLLLIGLALIFGIANKLAAYSGVLLFLFMWLAVLPPSHNPIIDDHIIYALTLIVLLKLNANRYLSYRKKWLKMDLVKNYPWLE